MTNYGLENLGVVGACKGSALNLIKLKHPFDDRFVPIVCSKHVTTDAGTGLVHIAPAHGVDDYVVGQKYSLPVDNPVDNEGKFYNYIPLVGGLSVWEATEVVVGELKKNNLLLCSDKLQHSYPHCWRHRTPIIFRATRQWFIGMDVPSVCNDAAQNLKSVAGLPDSQDNIRNRANSAVTSTEFFPGHPPQSALGKELLSPTRNLKPQALRAGHISAPRNSGMGLGRASHFFRMLHRKVLG